MGRDLDPLAAAGDHRQHRRPGSHHPHVMLQLRHILLGRRFLGERPGQHELGLEHRPAGLDPAVQGGRHPAQRRVPNPPLDVRDDLTGISLVPTPVEVLGDEPELDDEVAREVLRLGLAALLPPEPRRAASSSPMMIRASEPPMKQRRSETLAISSLVSSRSPCFTCLAKMHSLLSMGQARMECLISHGDETYHKEFK